MYFLRFNSFLLGCLLTLSGCAFGNRHAVLNYPTPSTPAAPPQQISVCLEQLRDGRSETAIGEVRNIYYMRTARVFPVNDVPTWATDALAKELEAAGYSVFRVPTALAHPECSTIIKGTLMTAFVKMWFSFNGEITLALDVINHDKTIISQTYVGTATGGDLTASGEAYAENLTRALTDAVQRFRASLSNAKLAAEPLGSRRFFSAATH